jgi:hypothetical protein
LDGEYKEKTFCSIGVRILFVVLLWYGALALAGCCFVRRMLWSLLL